MSSPMTITEAREKCKSIIAKVPKDGLILGILVLASSVSFGLGYLAGLDAGQASGGTLEAAPTLGEVGTPTETSGVVASKSGTKYYMSSCAGADRISDANKVWFASPAAAAAAGYSPAANCKGI